MVPVEEERYIRILLQQIFLNIIVAKVSTRKEKETELESQPLDINKSDKQKSFLLENGEHHRKQGP